MKAIKIDVEKQDVYPIEIGGELSDYYKAIGNNCELFCVPVVFPNRDGLYMDDEIILRRGDIKGGFRLRSYPGQTFVNNAILVGADEEGDSKDCETSLLDMKLDVSFVSESELLDEHGPHID